MVQLWGDPRTSWHKESGGNFQANLVVGTSYCLYSWHINSNLQRSYSIRLLGRSTSKGIAWDWSLHHKVLWAGEQKETLPDKVENVGCAFWAILLWDGRSGPFASHGDSQLDVTFGRATAALTLKRCSGTQCQYECAGIVGCEFWAILLRDMREILAIPRFVKTIAHFLPLFVKCLNFVTICDSLIQHL